jgi:lysophospholipase L1-like esterase
MPRFGDNLPLRSRLPVGNPSRIRSRSARLAGCVLVTLLVGCGGGGGGGGSSGIGIEDLNQDGTVRILCFGDSITRGVGDGPSADSLPPSPAGYPARLQPLLAPETKLPLVVIDDGVPGERTPDGVPRRARDLETNTPDYTILLEGTNDVEDGHADIALPNIQRMINSVFGAGAQPLLGTITPSCCTHKNQLPEPAILFYNRQLRAIAANNSIPLIDFYAAFTGGPEDPYDSTLGLIHVPEGLHPTPSGYDLMASTAQMIF